MPAVPISTIRNHPGDNRSVIAATFGRGVYEFRFAAPPKKPRDRGPDKPQGTERGGNGGGSQDEGDVLGSVTDPDDAAGSGLPFTGAQILMFLLIAVGLIAGGIALIKARGSSTD